MPKVNYSLIAETYDLSRSMPEQNLELWLKLISRKIVCREGVRLLDLGCGTGRFSIPMASRLGCSVTGADESAEMIRRARKKEESVQVMWVVENAGSLCHPNDLFDVVFMSHLLHHVDDPLRVLRECYRVLKLEGVILNRYGAMESIRCDPEHRFFPEAVKIDEARTPTVEQVEKWFRTAGFKQVSSETVVQQTFRSAEERVRKTSLKSISVLTLISESSFNTGMEALRRYVSENAEDPWLLVDRITLTVGRKLVRRRN